jgi:hypothetical protein
MKRIAKRYIWIAFALAGFTLAIVLVVVPAMQWRVDIEAAYENERQEQVRLIGQIRDLEIRRARLSQDEGQIPLWEAARIGEANARIQQALGRIGDESGLSFQSVIPSNPGDVPLVTSVGFRVEIEGTFDRIVSLLGRLESHNPPLLIERATLRRLSRPGERSSQPLLMVQLDLHAPVDLLAVSE